MAALVSSGKLRKAGWWTDRRVKDIINTKFMSNMVSSKTIFDITPFIHDQLFEWTNQL